MVSGEFCECPVCQCQDTRILLDNRPPLYKCYKCGHRFTDLCYWTVEQIEASHRGGEYTIHEDTYFRDIVRKELATTFAQRIPKGRILDLGCGNGIFLSEAKSFGYEVMGVDISPLAVHICKERGVPCEAGDFTTLRFDKLFDFVTMWDVIEHLLKPRAFIDRSIELLRPGGYIVIKTPHISALTFDMIAMSAVRIRELLTAVFLQMPAHLHFFTEKSLEQLLGSAGYKNFSWQRSRRMRGKRPIRSIRGLAGRFLRLLVNVLVRNGNLYIFGQKP
jgi:2-polyprenyl-3-methyl-5-hydroxy-6-metoxy-1,4-benzoquinol methylase